MADVEWVTLKEAARELRLSVSTLKRYIYTGKLRTYRTPGGRHRLRRRDLGALLGAAPPPSAGEETALAPLDHLAEDIAGRVGQALRRRLARIEGDVERLECSLDAITAAIRRAAGGPEQSLSAPRSPAAVEIKVLGPGCRACDRLANLVTEIAHRVGFGDESISRVREIDEIAEYGPTPMPALVVNNQLVAAGRVPTKSRLTELLQRYRSDESPEEAH